MTTALQYVNQLGVFCRSKASALVLFMIKINGLGTQIIFQKDGKHFFKEKYCAGKWSLLERFIGAAHTPDAARNDKSIFG